VPDLAGYLKRWAPLHGDYEPAPASVAGRWLTLAYTVARPLAARGVSPDALTGWGVLVSAAVAAIAAPGGRWPLAAIAVVVVAGLLDNLDGAVAILSGRTSRWGFVLDSLADRASDGLQLIALRAAGAPAKLTVAAGVGATALEYARARAAAAGFSDIGTITVGERPVRVAAAAAALIGAGVFPYAARLFATMAVGGIAAAGAVGTRQFVRVAAAALRERPAG
jgi:phosphatidylglycerophosphate synthase